MKKLLIIASAAIFFIGCDNKKESKENSESTSSAEKIDYAYLPANHLPDNWDRGDQKKIAMVLKSLKAFENGKLEEALAPFADSVKWSFDGFDAKISKDSLRSMFKGAWANMKSMKIEMGDYEAVISKDKKEEYVTLWYKELITDKAGKTDSTAFVDDLKIDNGKITELDEKTRKYPAKQ